MNPPNSINPPYSAMEYTPAPNAVVGGRNAEAILDAKTTPNPIARGPPMYRNLSLGAVRATVDNPPTIPAVYHAARVSKGPPRKQIGATTAPITAQCKAHASCFLLNPSS